jgi:peptidoglycan/LPS O-acetylase OafA/YrhL
LSAIWLGGLAILVVGPPIAYVICAFIPGMALAAAEVWVPARLAPHPTVGRRLAVAMGAIAVFPLVGYAFVPSPAPRAVFATLAIFLLLGSALVRQWSDGRASRALDNRVLHWLGVRAYSIYLIHFFVILQIGEHVEVADALARAAVVALVAVPITLLAAAFSYRWFERPFLARRAQ